jgi:hypothetical protein
VIRGTLRALVVSALAAGTVMVQGSANARFQYERTAEVVGAGAQRLEIDAPLLAGSQPFAVFQRGDRWIASGGLNDLRLFSAANAEIPFLLVPPAADAPSFVAGRVLPIVATEKTSGFEADLESITLVDTIDISRIPGPFLKRFTLEGSGDRERWTQLVAEGTAFNLPAEQLSFTRIGFDAGAYRYLRVTWDDTNSGRVPPPDTIAARRVTPASARHALRTPIAIERRPSEPARSRFRLTLPAPRLPIVELELKVRGGHLSREARVFEAALAGDQAQPQMLGRGRLVRVVRDQAAAEALRIPVRSPIEPQLELVVDDGDNPPLELEAVSAIFAELPWIYFEAPPGPITARYGDPKLAAPRYDLEAARDSIPGTLAVATWRPQPPLMMAPAPEGLPMPDTGSAIGVERFRFVRDIPAGPAGLIAVPLDAAVMAHSGMPPRRLKDVRVLDGSGAQVPYLLERRDEPLIAEARLERQPLPEGAPATPKQVTSYVIQLPYRELPNARLVFTTRARVFQRTVELVSLIPAAERRPARLNRHDRATWVHADQTLATPSLPLSFTLPSAFDGDLFLLVDEGDNQPLPIDKVTVLLPSYVLRLFRRADQPLRLAYGRDDLDAPRYDLQLLAPQLMGQRAAEVMPAAETSINAAATATVVSVPPLVFWSALCLAVVVLLVLVVRLMRREAV